MHNSTQGITYGTLLDQRQGQGFSEAEVRSILQQVLPQLAQIHNQGLLHGAISLDTLVQNEINRQVILVSSTNLNVLLYTAPEQLQSS